MRSSTAFFEALKPGERIPWQAWIVPMLTWGVLVALIFSAYLCLAVILRRQWVDKEKLSFPLVQLPLEMIRGDGTGPGGAQTGGFLKNSLTWIGFAIPAAVFGFNGLHQYFPSIPDVPTDIDLNALFTQPPFNQRGYFHLYLSFAAIGFFYLLPTDLLFSLWFFFLFVKMEEVGAARLGYEPETMPMYGCKVFVGYQIIGCYLALVGYMLYAARPHLKRVWAAATRLRRQPLLPEDDDEVLSYRTAFWGLVACVLLSAGWLWMFGMSYWLALFELVVLLFVVALVTLRARLVWFPLHPLGYALSGTWTMMVFWFPCFVAWFFKALILRYGGMRLYSRARPLFLGMVLGEFTAAILFTLPALYNRFTPTPTFPGLKSSPRSLPISGKGARTQTTSLRSEDPGLEQKGS